MPPKLKPVKFANAKRPWRVFIPGRYFADHIRKTKYFETEEQAEYFCLRAKREGLYANDFPKTQLKGNFKIYQSKVTPLFWKLDRRRLIPLIEVAKITGLKPRQLWNGIIPGARQIGNGAKKRWYFDRILLENWWEELNQKPITL